MQEKKFGEVAAREGCARWEKLIGREGELYERSGDIRSPFARDYTRILHSTAFRRLKHKTQVFFNAENDHVCTRMEHVAHVESVSYTIALYLGLNEELTRAIAFGHDLGHAPFGHHGERVIDELSQRHLGKTFWHESNGLRLADKLELLEDDRRIRRNLNLTFAVRDGIVAHCGELDQNALSPREELFDPSEFVYAGQSQPATWEGCVVKLADKIAYLGRDIEDALSLGFIDRETLREIEGADGKEGTVNTTVIMHDLVVDVCRNSSPEEGIRMSERAFENLTAVKNFNYEHIYRNRRFTAFQEYARLILNTLFNALDGLYDGANTFSALEKCAKYYPELCTAFLDWLKKYCEADILPPRYAAEAEQYANLKVYGRLEEKSLYTQAVIDFVSGMTDGFAVRLFGEQLRF